MILKQDLSKPDYNKPILDFPDEIGVKILSKETHDLIDWLSGEDPYKNKPKKEDIH